MRLGRRLVASVEPSDDALSTKRRKPNTPQLRPSFQCVTSTSPLSNDVIQPFSNSTLDLVARSGESCVRFGGSFAPRFGTRADRRHGAPSPVPGPRLAITVAQRGTWIIIRGVTRYVLVMKRCMS